MRAFRFGYQARGGTADELRAQARSAEAAGFHVISTFDHVGSNWGPTLPLLAMAEATTTLRVCPMVINNDFHHPVHLTAEYAALDHLTGGRVELGIGAGHSFTEYAAIGQQFDPPAMRKQRMAESIEVLRRLLDGETVTFHGEHYDLTEVSTMRSLQPRLPILVGVNGKAALTHAAQHADTIGLMMLGKTLEDGQRHEVRWQADRLDATVAFINDAAGSRRDDIELNALVQVVAVTDDRETALAEVCEGVPTLSLEDARTTPFIAAGTVDEIAAHLRACRDRWGITYFTVRDIDAFAPVIAALGDDVAPR